MLLCIMHHEIIQGMVVCQTRGSSLFLKKPNFLAYGKATYILTYGYRGVQKINLTDKTNQIKSNQIGLN